MSQKNEKKCDVLILSADFGTGHHQVSVALKGALKREEPHWGVEIYNYFEYINPLANRFMKFGYSRIIKYCPWLYGWFYEMTKQANPNSKWQQALNKVGRKKLLRLITHRSPRVIVCTFPTPAGVISRLKRENRVFIPLAVVITDVAVHSQWVHPLADIYIVAADEVCHCLMERGIPKEKIYVTGIPLRKQFEFPTFDPSIWFKYNLDPALFTLLIMGGGEGVMPGIVKICTELCDVSTPIQIVALTGTNKTLAENLEDIAQHSPIPIKVLGYTEEVASIMAGAHLLLSKAGGITVFEALAVKLPILLYKPLPGHEMCNVDFLLQNKAAFMANNKEQAVELIKKAIENPMLLKDISKSMTSISKPFSARDATDAIMAHALGSFDKKPVKEVLTRDKSIYATK